MPGSLSPRIWAGYSATDALHQVLSFMAYSGDLLVPGEAISDAQSSDLETRCVETLQANGLTMHSAIQLIAFWALAFATLSAALVLLNIYCNLLGSDIPFRSLRQEAAIAGIASLIEGASAWAILSFVPGAVRAMFIPALMVAIIYKVAHLEDWSRYHILLLLLFQVMLGASSACFYLGRIGSGLMIIGFPVAFLAVLAAIVRDS